MAQRSGRGPLGQSPGACAEVSGDGTVPLQSAVLFQGWNGAGAVQHNDYPGVSHAGYAPPPLRRLQTKRASPALAEIEVIQLGGGPLQKAQSTPKTTRAT